MGKWDAQLGLRLENTKARGESETLSEVHEDKYLKIFPTVYLLYTLCGIVSLFFYVVLLFSRLIFIFYLRSSILKYVQIF